MAGLQSSSKRSAPAQVEILAYAPTEFYHCQHCEVVWDQIGLGHPIHAEQRSSGLPSDLDAAYTAVADWAQEAASRYGERLSIKLIDPASLEGVFKTLRYHVRRFPAFVLNGRDRITGFDRDRWNAALAASLERNEESALRDVS
jgi:hypothetical protein